jgi:hypothetical protein
MGPWTEGIVVQLFYAQSSFPPNQCAPYQIKLDDGRLIFALTDENRVIRRVRMGAQAKAERIQRLSRLQHGTSAGLPKHEAWRLSESELWLPEEVLLTIVKINLDRASALAHRVAVSRLSSVCKAWDAALLPLFHPGVPGVITSAELRKLKRLALDQTDCLAYPRLASAGASDSPSQQQALPGFRLPESMLSADASTARCRTDLTERFLSVVLASVDPSEGFSTPPELDHLHPFLSIDDVQDKISLLLNEELYSRWPTSESFLDLVAHFTNTVCLAYRILMVVKAVEARAIARGGSPVPLKDFLLYLKDGNSTADVSLIGWRSLSPAGVLAQVAWGVHRESSESYSQMSQSLLAGSGATSLPVPTDVHN